MHITIDRSFCVSCGACWNTCPEVFEQNHCDSFSQLVEAYRFNCDRSEGEVTEDLVSCAREAAQLCPVEIIRTGNS